MKNKPLNVKMNSLSELLKLKMLMVLYLKDKKPLTDVPNKKSEPKKISLSPKNNSNKKMPNSSTSTPPEKEKNTLSIPLWEPMTSSTQPSLTVLNILMNSSLVKDLSSKCPEKPTKSSSPPSN